MKLVGSAMAEPWLAVAILTVLSSSTWHGAWAQDAEDTPQDSQNTTNDSNSSNACSANGSENDTNCSNATEAPCITDCCGSHIRREAYLACKEFMDFGLTEEICKSWENYAQTDCEFWCSDCKALGLTIYGQCIFYLGMLLPFSAAMDLCMTSRAVMEQARCPAACVDKLKYCQGPEYEYCNEQCGNFHKAPGVPRKGCDCWRERKMSAAPDVCKGETVNTGLIPFSRGLEHSCSLMPRSCMSNHIGTECGLYTYCDVDVCVVKNITCPFRGDCRSDGVCNKVNGKCYYLARPNGELCTDFTDWTHDDICESGECIGIEDKCMHYSTDCSTMNPCLEPRKLMTYQGVMSNCDTGSGSCMFMPRPDGTACASAYGGVVDGACKQGVCRRHFPDLCASRPACPDLGPCYNKSLCDSYSGDCVPVYMPDGYPCTDRRSNTYNDKCVQGSCVGDRFKEPTFQTKGSGDCIQHVSVLSECTAADCEQEDGRPAPRYYRDLLDAEECQARCKYDPDCAAYSYGYHVCSIYGTKRTDSPESWILETTAALIEHEVECWEKTEGEVWDFLVIVREYLFNITVFMMLFLPVSFTYCMFHGPIHGSYRRSLGIERSLVGNYDDELDTSNSDLSPRGGATIAQGMAMESCWDELENEKLQQLEPYPDDQREQLQPPQQQLDSNEQQEAFDVLKEAQEVEHPTDPRGEVADPEQVAAEGSTHADTT